MLVSSDCVIYTGNTKFASILGEEMDGIYDGGVTPLDVQQTKSHGKRVSQKQLLLVVCYYTMATR